MKKLGDKQNRYGSVSMSIKKMIQGAGSTYMHWVTLFESLDDDLFDGRLGEDDYEIPRVLIEYSVVGGNYTSIINKMGQLKDKIKDHEEIQGMNNKPGKKGNGKVNGKGNNDVNG